MAYATLAEIKNELRDALGGSINYDSVLEQLASWASEYIDLLFGHAPGGFEVGTDPPPTPAAKRYNGSGRDELVIAECISVAKVEYFVGGAWTELAVDTDVVTLPMDETPIYGLQLIPTGSKQLFDKGVANWRITAVLGYSAVAPGPIKQAVITQTVRWFKRAQSAFGDVSAAPELGQLQYLQELDPDIKAMMLNSGLMRPTL